MADTDPVPAYSVADPRTDIHLGDCRQVLPALAAAGFSSRLIFADPPFNQGEPYGTWRDNLARADYLNFTDDWLAACVAVLAADGSFWVNCPDHIAADVVCRLRDRHGLLLVNWCVWTHRFGMHRSGSFIVAKTHALYFARSLTSRVWNPDAVLVQSDRASKYADPRTFAKGKNPGLRVPLDVWGSEGDGGTAWGRVQGNNKERRALHPNQLPEVYLERIIRACSSPGDVVLDPFLGSGTTAVVARTLGRGSVGIEIDPAFARSAYERLGRGAVRVQAAAAQEDGNDAQGGDSPTVP